MPQSQLGKIKHYIEFWRPRDAIRSADLDGNSLTTVDSQWEAFRGAGRQGSSPEYLSGQATFAGAWSTVLANFNGDDNFNFSLALDTLGSWYSTLVFCFF